MSALSETAGRVAPPDVDSLTRETPSEEHVENFFRCHITLEPVGGVVLVKVAVPSTSAKGIRIEVSGFFGTCKNSKTKKLKPPEIYSKLGSV